MPKKLSPPPAAVAWPSTPVTLGLPPAWDNAWLLQKPVQPIKKIIPEPSYVAHRSLKLKAKEK